MKSLIFLCIFLVGCCQPKPPIKVPVYKVPEFEMPIRPTMLTSGGSVDETSKAIETNMINMQKYSGQLETILETLKNQKQ